MSRQQLIDRTPQTLAQLPDDKVYEVFGFAGFLLKKAEESILQKGIGELVSSADSFNFLKEEEDFYTVADLKERF